MQRKPSINHEGEKMEELNKKLNEKARKQHLPFLLLGIVLLIIAAVIIGPAASKTLNARNLSTKSSVPMLPTSPDNILSSIARSMADLWAFT